MYEKTVGRSIYATISLLIHCCFYSTIYNVLGVQDHLGGVFYATPHKLPRRRVDNWDCQHCKFVSLNTFSRSGYGNTKNLNSYWHRPYFATYPSPHPCYLATFHLKMNASFNTLQASYLLMLSAKIKQHMNIAL